MTSILKWVTGISLGSAGFVVIAALVALAIFVRTDTFQNGLRDRILQIARKELDVSIQFKSAKVEIFTLEPKIHFQDVVVSDEKQKVSVEVRRVAAGISVFSLPLLAFRQLVLSTAELEGLQYQIKSTRVFDRWLRSFRPRSGFVPVRFQTSVKRVILTNVMLDVDLPASEAGGYKVSTQLAIDTAQLSLTSNEVVVSGLVSARQLRVDGWGPYDLELSLDRGAQNGSSLNVKNLQLRHEDNFLSVSGSIQQWKDPILNLTGEGSIDVAKYLSGWQLFGKIEGDFGIRGPWRSPEGSGTARVINGQWRIKKFDELKGSWSLKDRRFVVPSLTWKQGAETGSGNAVIPFDGTGEASFDLKFKHLNIASYVGLADPILSRWQGEAEGQFGFRGSLEKKIVGDIELSADVRAFDIRSFGETSILKVPDLKFQVRGRIEESVKGQVKLSATTASSQATGTATWDADSLNLQWLSQFDGSHFADLFGYKVSPQGELRGQLGGPWTSLVLEAQPNFKNFRINGQDIHNVRGTLRLAHRQLMAAPLNADQVSLLGGIVFPPNAESLFKNFRFTVRKAEFAELFGFIGVDPQTAHYPQGKLSGKGSLAGPVLRPTGTGQVLIEDWQFGNSMITRGRRLSSQWACSRGMMYFEDIEGLISDRSGRVSGDMSLDGRGIADVHLAGTDLRFSDWAHFLGADLGLQARTQATFDYQRDIPSARATVALQDTSFGGLIQKDSSVTIEWMRDRLNAEAQLFGEGLGMQWKSVVEGRQVRSRFDLDLRQVNLSPWIPLISPSTVETLVTGKGHFNFAHRLQPESSLIRSLFVPPVESVGSVRSEALVLRKTSMVLQEADPFDLTLSTAGGGDLVWRLDDLRLRSADRLLQVSGFYKDPQVFGFEFRGTTDLRVLSAFSSLLSRSEGLARVQGDLDPRGFSGKLLVDNALVTFQDTPLLIRDVDAELTAKHSHFTIQSLQGEFRDGSMTAAGDFHLSRDSMDLADVRLQLDQVLVQPDLGTSFKASGPLRLSIARDAGEVTGKIFISEGLFRKRIDLRSDLGKFFKKERRKFQSRTDVEGAWRQWRLNVQVVSSDPFQIRNNVGEGAANLNLQVVGRAGEPRVGGYVEIVRGQFTFHSREFQVRSGSIQFKDPQSNVPNYDIRAETEIEDYRIFMRLQGGPGDQKITYSSEPPLSEKDIISLISFGIPASAKEMKDEDQSRSVGLTGFSFVTGALQDRIEYRLSQDLGIQRFQLGPAFFDQTGRTELQLTVGTDLVRNKLAVNYSNFLSTTGGHKVELDFKVNRNVSLIGSWRDVREQEGRSGESKDDFGGDVRFRFEFD